MVSGFSKVEACIRSDGAAVIVHSVQAAPDGKGKLEQALRVMDFADIPVFGKFTGEELDAALGLENATYLALVAGKLSDKFVASVRRMEAFEAN